MAFIGTPLDTRNTFQSLQGKRFNGDGSTTAFTLDVAPSSTLDIEVFVGNVRQDPNSAYTLSGTTLTFTGAPPSGTNNIYVVHQAKAVGTIEIPATTGSEKTFTGGVVIADDSDGSNGLKIGTGDDFKIYHDGTHTYMDNNTGALFMRNNGSVVIEDLSGNNIIRGIDGAAVDLYHNGTSVLNTTATGATVTTLGVVNEKDLGVGIHIKTADTSASAVSGSADELVIEGTGNVGMTVQSANDGVGNIYFGDVANGSIGRVSYDHSSNFMSFNTNASERMRIASDGDVGIGTTSPGGALEVANTSTEIQVLATGNSSANELIRWNNTNDTSTSHTISFFKRNGTTTGSITQTNNATAFNTSSDYRTKENVNYSFDATSRLKQLKPARFNFITDADNTVDGFIAHEVSSIVPEAISGTKDATETKTKVVLNASGNLIKDNVEQSDWIQGKTDGIYANNTTWEASKVFPVYQAIDQSRLVPLLVKTILELEARVTTLEE